MSPPTSASPPPLPTPPIPILLLKSPSPTPSTDPYTTHLTTPSPTTTTTTTTTHPPPPPYTPHYIPVLTHTLHPDPLITLLLTHLHPPFPYGALILTSQRAVLALKTALTSPPLRPHLPTLLALKISLYTVGPATFSALKPIRDALLPQSTIHGGADAGSAEILAAIILGTSNERSKAENKYTTRSPNGAGMKPMLFLTGSHRRDTLPKTLTAPALGPENKIPLDEMIVYNTTALDEFEFAFARVLRETETAGVRWVVVFSPTAGRGILRALGWLDDGVGNGRCADGERRTFVACIGPTTREYLERELGFRADVVAERPSPEGVRDGIERFVRERGMEV